ncbi:MAG: IS1096 element passenger TnpR family protein [Bacteroidota bacterium]
MVFKFRLISNEEKDFIRDIELLSDQTFYDFHRTITQNLHYDKSQIASFFISNEKWEKLEEITLFDMSEGTMGDKVHVMDKTHINDYVKKIKQRLLYVFDFFNERVFFIELIDIEEKKEKHAYPLVTLEKGIPPRQLLIDDTGFEDLNFEE